MFRFAAVFFSLALAGSSLVLAQDPDDLVFKSSFEKCDNLTIPPGAVVWDGGGDGETWSDPLNWAGDVAPVENDSVAIGVESTVAVIYDNTAGDSGTTVLTSLDTCQTLRITSGTLQLEGPSATRGYLELAGGNLLVNDSLSTAQVFHSGGTLDGSGTVNDRGRYSWSGGT